MRAREVLELRIAVWVSGFRAVSDKVEDPCCTTWQLVASLVHGECSKDFSASRCSFAGRDGVVG